MFTNSAQRLTNKLVDNGVIEHSDFELYSFGFEMGFAIVANILTTIVIGFAFRMPLESLLFLVAFIPLRSYVGGYHTANHTRCYWVSFIAVIVVLLAVRLVLNVYNVTGIMSIGIVCTATMFALVPVQDANRPLDEIEIRVYGLRARIVLCIELSALLVFLMLGFRTIAAVMSCTLCLAFISTCAGAVKNYIKPIPKA